MSEEKKVVTSRQLASGDGLLALNVGPAQLARLLSRNSGTITYWAEHRGLPRTVEGLYNVKAAILWLERYLRNKRPALTLDAMGQRELSRLLDVSRQSLTAWSKAGLPRRRDGKYDLKTVCRWLPIHYCKTYERKYAERLMAIEIKLRRNVRQIERFLAGGKSE